MQGKVNVVHNLRPASRIDSVLGTKELIIGSHMNLFAGRIERDCNFTAQRAEMPKCRCRLGDMLWHWLRWLMTIIFQKLFNAFYQFNRTIPNDFIMFDLRCISHKERLEKKFEVDSIQVKRMIRQARCDITALMQCSCRHPEKFPRLHDSFPSSSMRCHGILVQVCIVKFGFHTIKIGCIKSMNHDTFLFSHNGSNRNIQTPAICVEFTESVCTSHEDVLIRIILPIEPKLKQIFSDDSVWKCGAVPMTAELGCSCFRSWKLPLVQVESLDCGLSTIARPALP
mmetsp:Transcript_33421/g.80910  ORF Transcript_33421/g.80910 Transcript_33421/m.80910 type:complete len:283 (+) Transcript_33421:700-1548(+)